MPLLLHSQGQGSESIRHYGASELIESRSNSQSKGKDAKVSCVRREARRGDEEAEEEEEEGKVQGQYRGRKAIFWSFKELLFHGKLKSHYKDYMAANNVRQISI